MAIICLAQIEETITEKKLKLNDFIPRRNDNASNIMVNVAVNRNITFNGWRGKDALLRAEREHSSQLTRQLNTETLLALR